MTKPLVGSGAVKKSKLLVQAISKDNAGGDDDNALEKVGATIRVQERVPAVDERAAEVAAENIRAGVPVRDEFAHVRAHWGVSISAKRMSAT